MTNLEYLKEIKKIEKEKFSDKRLAVECVYEDVELRRNKALEIIAEELCKLNDSIVKVEMLKPSSCL